MITFTKSEFSWNQWRGYACRDLSLEEIHNKTNSNTQVDVIKIRYEQRFESDLLSIVWRSSRLTNIIVFVIPNVFLVLFCYDCIFCEFLIFF